MAYREKFDFEESNERFHSVNIFILTFLFVAGLAYFTLVPKDEYSDYEKRKLAAFPEYKQGSVLDGSFSKGIYDFINDAVPYRDKLKDVAADVKHLFGLKFNDVIIDGPIVKPDEPSETLPPLATRAPKTEAPDTDATPAIVTTEEPETQETNPPTTTAEEEDAPLDINEINESGVIIIGDRGMPVYYGSFSRGERYAESVNLYKKYLGKKVNVYSMVVPTAQSFYLPAEYDGWFGSEPENLENIRNYLDGVEEVNVFDTLDAHKDEYIYSRTDHHWAPLGAYYAAKTFAEQLDLPFTDISEYTEKSEEGYVGTLYSFTEKAVLKNNPDTFIWHVPPTIDDIKTEYYTQDYKLDYEGELLPQACGSSLYMTMIGGDAHVVKITTPVKNGRHLVVIKDSYGNALAPYLTSSFETITFVDMRYFELNIIDFIEEQGMTDVLFAMNTFSATGPNMEYINELTLQ